MYFLNIVLFIVTILAYLLPFLAPKAFPILSVFSLFLPFFIFLNAFFFLYWLLQLKRRMFISGIVLLIGISFISRLYKFSTTEYIENKNDITLLSYNVRLFNLYEWLPKDDTPHQISEFVKTENPDILSIQEFSPVDGVDFSQYKYKHIVLSGKKNKYGQALFTKFPMLYKGIIEFPNSSNSVIYADIKKGNDTIRIYSMHLQSIKISADIHENIDEQKSLFIFNRLSKAFKIQQQQVDLIRQNMNSCSYKKIICGDLNNSAFSYVYKHLKGDMKDAFQEAGSGFGKSYNYKYYPARIDYIFMDKSIQVKSYESFTNFFHSDHFPVVTRFSLEKITAP